MAEDKEVKEEGYQVVESPVQFERVIQTPEGKIMRMDQAIASLLNDVSAIKKNLLG